MICVPGKIRTRLSFASYFRKYGDFQSAAAWNRRRVECDTCHANLAACLLWQHLETQHGIYQANVVDAEYLESRPAVTYQAYLSADGKLWCPVPGCVGEAHSKRSFHCHFAERHPLDLVDLVSKGIYPCCTVC